MSGEYVAPDAGMPIEHVIDRYGYVWRVVRDGGMATRAHYAGLVSIGIAALERESGPLVTLAARDAATRADAWDEGKHAGIEEMKRMIAYQSPMHIGVRPGMIHNPYRMAAASPTRGNGAGVETT